MAQRNMKISSGDSKAYFRIKPWIPIFVGVVIRGLLFFTADGGKHCLKKEKNYASL
jgi:hypothetical protein